MESRSLEYCTRATRLGRLVVAGSERGICFVGFADAEEPLALLARELPVASFRRARGLRLRGWAREIARYVEGRCERVDAPLDVRGSQFQRRVWAALRRIPRGETRAYSDVARALGAPRGARAVARACASNPVPVLTPCHRVVEKGGGLGGYAWGSARKRALLELEGAIEDPAAARASSAS